MYRSVDTSRRNFKNRAEALMDDENYVVFDMEAILEAYEDDKESIPIVKAIYTALFRFLEEHGCVKVRLLKNGKLIRTSIRKDQLTAGGLNLAKKAIPKMVLFEEGALAHT